MKVCICDDNKKQRENLKAIVEVQMELRGLRYEVVQHESGEELIEYIKGNHEVDMIFLDIEMGGINGVETARRIREEDKNVVIIFITGFSEYVFDGYEVNALNYVMKPYKKEKIIKVINQGLQQIAGEGDRFFLFEQGKKSIKINLRDILFFSSERRKVKVVTKVDTFEFYNKISDIEEELKEGFIRIHQRYLVNIRHIEKIENNEVLIEGKRLPISRGRVNEVNVEFARFVLR